MRDGSIGGIVFSSQRRQNANEKAMKPLMNIIWLAGLFLISGCVRETESQSQTGSQTPDSIYLETGNKIAAATFDTLRNSLLAAVRDGGFDSAVAFCNLDAYSLTNTYGDSVVVRRTSSRVRNLENAPSDLELVVLNEFQSVFENNGQLSPRVVRSDTTSSVHFFKPIITQAFCLNCHGEPGKDIKSVTLARLSQLFPEDRAVNYKEGELRGVWHLVFDHSKK
jgi:hypothetical protein